MKIHKMRVRVTGITLLLMNLYVYGFGNDGKADVLDYTASPGTNYDIAAFRLWLPENTEYLRAALVMVPGSNWDGRNDVNDPVWQDFAQSHHLALVSCYFTDKPHEQGFIEEYVNVSQGSGQALLDALDAFGSESGHPELAAAPILLWGMSAGGEYNYEFAAWKPERVLAFVVNKGGIYYSALVSQAAQQVPGLLFIGEKDMAFRTDTIIGLFAINRRAGALWALVPEPNTAHETARSRELALPFFEDVLAKRLKCDSNGHCEMLPVPADSGYLGDLETHACSKIQPGDPAPDHPTSWLISEKVARVWQSIVNGAENEPQIK